VTTEYSHSRLSAYENCPKRYAYRYVEGIESDLEGVEAFVGKRVHEVIERLYLHLGEHGRPPSLAQVHDRFQREWRQTWHARVSIVRTENDEAHYVEHGLRCLSSYYRDQYPFDRDKTVAVEKAISLTLDSEGRYRMRGIIDRVACTGPGQLEVHDYKTGSMPPKRVFEKDRQLALYQIGIEQMYPDVEQVDLVWHYLAFDRTIRVRRSSEQLAQLRVDTMALIDRIEAASEFPARPGTLCAWCEFREICPAVRPVSEPAAVADRAEPVAAATEAPGVEPHVPDARAARPYVAAPVPRGQLSLL